MRTLFRTFTLGCWLYTAISIIITLIVLAIVVAHSPQIATPPALPIP